MLKPGEMVDRYRVERPLGEGGMASVYQVTHSILGSLHALKVLRPDLVADEDLRGRFLAEGQIQAQLRHPNIASATDIVALPDVAGIVMEYLEGPSLEDYIDAQDAALPLEEQLAIMLPLLDAVGYAHDQGVVHRDLKPSNVILALGPAGDVRPAVLDFGIAKLAEDADVAHHKKRTRTGVRMGTTYYMSPEQIRGAADVDRRTDVFALGAILYELATGWLAFDGNGEFETMQRIVEGRFEPFPAGPAAPHPVVQSCVQTALAASPEQRFPDCTTFAATLGGLWQDSRPPLVDAANVRRALDAAAAPEYERLRAGQIKALRRRVNQQQQALDWRAMAGALEELAGLEPEVADHREALVNVYLRLNRPDQVAAHLEGLSQLQPDRPSPLERLVEHHLSHGDPDAAIQVLRRLVDLVPRERGPLDQLASLLDRGERHDEAVEVRRQLLSVVPDDPEVRFAVAETLRRAGDDEAAEREYRGILERDPRHARARHRLGILLHRLLEAGRAGGYAEVVELLGDLHLFEAQLDLHERVLAHLVCCSALIHENPGDDQMSNSLLNVREDHLDEEGEALLGRCWWRVGEQLAETADFDGALAAYTNAGRMGLDGAKGRIADLYLRRSDDLARKGKLADARTAVEEGSAYIEDEAQVQTRLRALRFRSLRRWAILVVVVVPILVTLAGLNFLAHGKTAITLSIEPDPVGGAWGITLPDTITLKSGTGKRVILRADSSPGWNQTTATYTSDTLRSGTWTLYSAGTGVRDYFHMDSDDVSVPWFRLRSEEIVTLTAAPSVPRNWGVIQIGEFESSANVYVDEAKLRDTPFTLYATTGKHVIVVRQKDADAIRYEVDLEGSEVVTVP